MNFDISDSAISKIAEHTETPDQKLRIKVVGGGCSGLRYELMLDKNIKDTDMVIRDTIIIDEKSALYLSGSSLEYMDTIMESGFQILNPNARSTCGCGESFAY